MKINRDRVNTCFDGSPTTFTSTYVIPAGAQVTSGDIIQWTDIAALHTVEAVRVFTSDLDDGTTLTSNWGIQQIAPGVNTFGGLNASGVATDFDVATSTTYTSPATNATYFQSGNAVVGRAQGWSSLTLANTADINGPGGPFCFISTWTNTPTQTTASLVDRTIRVEFAIVRATLFPSNVVNLGGY